MTQHSSDCRGEALRFLAQTSEVLESPLGYETALRSVVHLAVPYLGELCAIHLLTGPTGEGLRLLAAARAGSAAAGHPGELPVSAAELLGVARAGAPRIGAEGPGGAAPGEGAPAMSVVIIPLRARGRALGTLTCATSTRRYLPADLTLLEELGRGCALAIDNGQLAGVAPAALPPAEAAADERAVLGRQQAAVASLGQQALGGRDLSALTDEAMRLVRDTLGTEMTRLMEISPAGDTLSVRAGAGWPEGVVGSAQVGADAGGPAAYTRLHLEGSLTITEIGAERRFPVPPFLHVGGVVSEISAVVRGVRGPLGVLCADSTRRRAFSANDVHFVEAVAGVLAAAMDRQREQRAERFLIEASTLLSTSLDCRTTIEQAVRLAVPLLCDNCVVDLVEDDALRMLAMTSTRPEWAAALVAQRRRRPPASASNHPIWQALRAERPIFLPEAGEALLDDVGIDEEHRYGPGGLSVRSALFLPLRAHGRTLGVMSMSTAYGGRALYPEDQRVAEEFARRTAVAVDNARLYEAEKRARAQAEAALQARDDFLSIAAHELRTPLTTLQLQLESMLRLGSDPGIRSGPRERGARQAGKLERALRQTARLSTLVNSLVDASRLTGSPVELHPEEFELGAALGDLVEHLQGEAARAGCALGLRVDGPCFGAWDRLRIEQMVASLLHNALKYGAGKPVEVLLEGAEEGRRARIRVRDQGIGIGEEDQGRIFDRFERAVSVRSYGGLGLGLYFARQIAGAHGGTISVASRPDAGATFTIELPRYPAAEAAAAAALEARG